MPVPTRTIQPGVPSLKYRVLDFVGNDGTLMSQLELPPMVASKHRHRGIVSGGPCTPKTSRLGIELVGAREFYMHAWGAAHTHRTTFMAKMAKPIVIISSKSVWELVKANRIKM